MAGVQICDFTVPIHHEGGEARVYVLWPCSATELRQFMNDQFALDSGERNTWKGICITEPEVDAKHGCPTAVIAFQSWELNEDKIALLAHECFHATEWILKQSGHIAPIAASGERWKSWEDMAYLLQNLMRRALKTLAGDSL